MLTLQKVSFSNQILLNSPSGIHNYAQDDIWVLEEVLTDIQLGSVNSVDWLLTSYQRYSDLNGESKYLMAKHILDSIFEFTNILIPPLIIIKESKKWYISKININPEYDVIHYTVELR